MSAQNKLCRVTAADIKARKGGVPIVSLTAYDAPMAAILDPHCDFLLVGDSVGMVVHGLSSTVGVTLEMMILHGQAVMRGSSRAMVIVDMPFGSYELSADLAFTNAVRLMKETGCQAIKIESGTYASSIIKTLVERGIPVMGHVGLRPQGVNVEGSFKAKGRNSKEWQNVIDESRSAEEAGAFGIVVEGVDEDLAQEITQTVGIPTIGIGASAQCDGQILVTQDMLGLFEWTPKFVKQYGDLRQTVGSIAEQYADDVRSRRFPGVAEVYNLKPPAIRQKE